MALIFYLLLIPGLAFGASQDTSSTTAATATTRVRYYINESVESTWSDTELLGWLNDAQMDIAARTQCKETSEEITLIANTLQYAVVSDYIAVSAVVYSPASGVGKGLIRGHPSQVGHTGISGTSEPNRWYDWKGEIGIYPVLTAVTTEEIVVYLVAEPTALTDSTSVIDVPQIYDRAVVLYAAAQAFLKTGQYAKSGRLMAEYYAEINRFRQDYVIRPKMPKASIAND